jgi:hypothetical protein
VAAASCVRLDLNSPEFQNVFFRLELAELKQVVASLRRLSELDWSSLYRHTGFRWDAAAQKARAVAYRDGQFLSLVSLHPGHDSAYEP